MGYWFLIALIMIIIELSTVNLVSIWFAFASVVAGVSTLITDNITIQVIVFIISSIIFLIITKPVIKKIRGKEIEKVNLDRVVGKVGIVTEDIEPLSTGEVKVDGKRWSAISNEEIKKDSKVEILSIDGVKLLVRKMKEED